MTGEVAGLLFPCLCVGESTGPQCTYTVDSSLTGFASFTQPSTTHSLLWEEKGSTEAGVDMGHICTHHRLQGCYASQPGSLQLQTHVVDPLLGYLNTLNSKTKPKNLLNYEEQFLKKVFSA